MWMMDDLLGTCFEMYRGIVHTQIGLSADTTHSTDAYGDQDHTLENSEKLENFE